MEQEILIAEIKKSVEVEKFNLSENQLTEITAGLAVVIEQRNLLIDEFNVLSKLEITKENIVKFKELNQKFVKNRTQGIDVWHKVGKDVFLRAGQLYDALKRQQYQINESYETPLTEKAKYFETIEKQRIADLEIERGERLAKFTSDLPLGLGSMSNDMFENYIAGVELNYNKKIEAEKQAEAERLEIERKAKLNEERKAKTIRLVGFIENYESLNFGEISEDEFIKIVNLAIKERASREEKQKAIEAENLRLKKEAEDKKERDIKRTNELRPYINFVRDYNKMLILDEKEYQKEFSDIKIGANQQWEFDKQEQEKARKQKEIDDKKAQEEKAKQDEIIRKQNHENARLKAENNKRLKEEADKKEREEKQLKAKQLAPDKEKLSELAKQISSMQMPILSSKEAVAVLENVKILLGKTSTFINDNLSKI